MIGKIFSALVPSLAPEIAALQHATLLTKVTGYAELIWYANPPELDRIGQGPPIGPPSHGLTRRRRAAHPDSAFEALVRRSDRRCVASAMSAETRRSRP